MKRKARFLSIILLLGVFLSSCGNSAELHIVDQAGTKWTSEAVQMEFVVDETGIVDATIMNKNDDKMNVIVSFTNNDEKMTVVNASNNETIFIGDCTFNKNTFKVAVTDIFDLDFKHLPSIITFKRSKL